MQIDILINFIKPEPEFDTFICLATTDTYQAY